MKYLKFYESLHKDKYAEIIDNIWYVSEDELISAFSDLEEECDVDIDISYRLLSPSQERSKTTGYILNDRNVETMEAYAAAGFTPRILIEITVNDNTDKRQIQSLSIECIQKISDYKILSIEKNSLTPNVYINIGLENGESEKIHYHKKPNSFWYPFISEFKNRGYKIVVNKLFINTDGYIENTYKKIINFVLYAKEK